MSDEFHIDITPEDLSDRITIKLYPDTESTNPRENFDHAGTLYYESDDFDDFDLSDKGASLPATASWSSDRSDIAVAARWIELHGGVAVPMRADDYGSNGGRAYSSDAENANGLIWIDAEKIAAEWTAHGTPDPKSAAIACLESEITELDQYLSGDVYGYVVETLDGDHLDSCWGFYGEKYAKEEALSAGQHAAGEIDKRAAALTAARGWAFSRILGAKVAS